MRQTGCSDVPGEVAGRAAAPGAGQPAAAGGAASAGAGAGGPVQDTGQGAGQTVHARVARQAREQDTPVSARLRVPATAQAQRRGRLRAAGQV